MKKGLALGIIFLFLFSALAQISIGYNTDISDSQISTNDYSRYLYPEFYNCYNAKEKPDYATNQVSVDSQDPINIKTVEINNPDKTIQTLNGPMDSPWPMYCHDVRHTGRSPYSVGGNTGVEKWRFDTIYETWSSPVIDYDGIIYIGGDRLYAVYPNGTMKWQFTTRFSTASAPAIDKNGILYTGSIWAEPNYMYAIYTSNGSLKWKFKTNNNIFSSPAIGNDGSIYFGSEDDYIYALYPNGTLKWKYLTSVAVYSSPAIGLDGIVYCGSHDTYLYAFYPDNGTVKWKYKTGNWIRVSPCIDNDGIIYVVSLDNYLHAVNPDGSLKWKTGVGAGTSPTIGVDGTIYAGWNKLFAINPTNGSVKWTFNPGGVIEGGTPCNSIDGTIIFGTRIVELDGGELIAVNPDGTRRWRIKLATDYIDSAPAIGIDGTIYVGSDNDGNHPGSLGYLHAIGNNPNVPPAPEINGPKNGKRYIKYTFTFCSVSPVGNDIYYSVNWKDGNGATDWLGPYPSGIPLSLSHRWGADGEFNIEAQVKDVAENYGGWSYFNIRISFNRASMSSLFFCFLERFPILDKLLYLMKF